MFVFFDAIKSFGVPSQKLSRFIATMILTGALLSNTSSAFAYGVNECAASRFGTDLGCTANDVAITGIAVSPGSPTKCVGGSTYTTDLDITVNFQNPARYDIGIFLSQDGNDPQTLVAGGGAATCSVGVLPTTSPFKDLDPNGGVDTCGDGDSSLSGVVRMNAVPVACKAAPLSNGNLFIPFVVTWDNTSTAPGAVCTSIADPFPNTVSKCNAPDSTVLTEVQYGTVGAVVLPSITKDDNISILTAGDTTTYTVVITNTTGAELSNALFQDPAVDDLTINNLTCAASGGALCPASNSIAVMQGGGLLLSNMPINSTLTFTIEATVNAAASAGTITNTASVLVRGETNSASDTNNVITKFNATKTFTPASITAGDTSVMDITLQNTNLGAATNIVFNDIYPSGLVNTGAPGVTNSCGGTIIATAGGNSLALSGGTLAPGASCTITANVTSASTGAYSNSTGTISSDQFVGDPAFATLAVGVSSLQTATKSWQDLNGGEANPGDTIRYTIILTETAGVAATGVSVSDLLPVTLSGATVTSCPTGATCNVAGQTLTATNIAIPANGSVSIVFDASIAPGTTAATAINNCASISNPTGIGASPCASTITVSPSAVAITGNKWLYLDSGTTLSRTKPTGTPSAVTIADGASQTWSLSPILAMPVTISPLLTPLAIIPVNLYLASGTADETRSARVTVACSGGGTTYSQEMTFDGTALNNPYLSTTPNLVLFNNLPFSAEQTCAAGQSWDLTVQNTTTDKNSDILVYPVSGTNTSYFSLPSLSVINVDSVNNYDAVYPAVTTPAGGNFNPGQTVYVRAIVSDPFGSYDISSVAITITDPNGTNRVTLAAMTEVADSLAATKTFEYAYAVPAFPAVGNWNVTVTANEGAEGTVTDDNTSAFAVGTPANLTIVKAADKPSVSPGELVIYTITVNNSGSSSANSVIVTDAMSPFTSLVLDPFGNGTPFNFSDTSGLSIDTIEYANGTDGSGNPNYGYAPTPGGGGAPVDADGNITHWRITMNTGTSMASSGQFVLTYQAYVK